MVDSGDVVVLDEGAGGFEFVRVRSRFVTKAIQFGGDYQSRRDAFDVVAVGSPCGRGQPVLAACWGLVCKRCLGFRPSGARRQPSGRRGRSCPWFW